MASFSDDFNRADSTDLGAGWVEVSGNWAISSNRLSPGVDAGTVVLRAAAAMDSSDNYAQVTVASIASASQGVWCRGDTGLSNGYLFRSNGSSWDLFAVVGGSFNLIGTYAAALTAGDVARVQAVGSTIRCYVNGVQQISVTNTGVTTGTSVGLRSDSASAIRYDDFVAGDVTAGVSLGVASATEAAQALTGIKDSPLGAAAAVETAQALTGAKGGALGLAAASETATALTGAKAAPLGTVLEVATAQGLVGSKRATLLPALAREQAVPLGDGSVEPTDPDLDVTVGAPYSPWAAGAPEGSGWEVGAPC